MAEMVCSAVVQETVSRGVSFMLGKREEMTSQASLMERLKMAASELGLTLERSAKLPIADVFLVERRKVFKCAYIEATERLRKHKQEVAPTGQEEISQGVKRKRWIIHAKNRPISSSNGLKRDDVVRFEWLASCADKFLRELESGCSLHHYPFCNPIVRCLLEGKTLLYRQEQGNKVRFFIVWPTWSAERGVEALLAYSYKDSTLAEESFFLCLLVRLSQSTDIVGIAIKTFQLLRSQSNLAPEYAMREIGLLPDLSLDMTPSYAVSCVGIKEWHSEYAQLYRGDPVCCKARRDGLCGNEDVMSSELTNIFAEEVIFCGFICYIPALLEPRFRLRSSCNEADRSVISRAWASPLVATVTLAPHHVLHDTCAYEVIGNNAGERREASIQEVATTIKSRAITCLERDPKVTKYEISFLSKHGGALFMVEKPRMERTRRQCKTRRGKCTGS